MHTFGKTGEVYEEFQLFRNYTAVYYEILTLYPRLDSTAQYGLVV